GRAWPGKDSADGILLDIGKRRAEQLVNTRLAAIVSSSDDAIVGKTTGGIVTDWNEAAERIFGYSAEEMIGQPVAKIMPAGLEDEEQKILFQICAGRKVDHFETRRLRKDG